jgi:quinol-cytochrome oxidoreductase complex cytochrome b subunit
MNNLENKTNKLKLLFGLIISIFFVLMGIYLFTKPEKLGSSYPTNKIAGIVNIVFFGIIGLIGFKKFMSR